MCAYSVGVPQLTANKAADGTTQVGVTAVIEGFGTVVGSTTYTKP